MIRTAFEGGGRAGQLQTVQAPVSASTSASANTKGAYAQMTASTPATAVGIQGHTSEITVLADYAVDVAIGAGGSEQIVLANVLHEAQGSKRQAGAILHFGVAIPLGTRLAIRGQASSAGAKNFQWQTILLTRGVPQEPVGQVTTYGVTTSGATTGTSVDPGAVANTFGAYVQITASTSLLLRRVLVTAHNQLVNHLATYMDYQVAIGAGGSEQIIARGYLEECQSLVNFLACNGAIALILPLQIPAGTRIAIRNESDETASGSRSWDFSLHAST